MKKRIIKFLGIVLGVLVLAGGVYDHYRFNHIRSMGVTTTIVPVEQYYHTKKSTYYADFSFTTKTGEKIIQNNVYFPEVLLRDFESDTPVIIYYDPQEPTRFIFEKDTAPWTLIWLGAFFIVAACVPLIGNIRVR